jgi:hypothetical protein
MTDNIYRNPVSDYTCPRQAGLEREVFFRRGPINIGLGCLLPNPGDWMTHDYTGCRSCWCGSLMARWVHH